MLIPNTLQNESNFSKEQPTIIIKNIDSNWHEAYTNWINMKNPTNSKKWNKGIYLTFKEQS